MRARATISFISRTHDLTVFRANGKNGVHTIFFVELYIRKSRIEREFIIFTSRTLLWPDRLDSIFKKSCQNDVHWCRAVYSSCFISMKHFQSSSYDKTSTSVCYFTFFLATRMIKFRASALGGTVDEKAKGLTNDKMKWQRELLVSIIE